MSDNWSVIKQEVSTYRKYVAGMPKDASAAASYCFLLKKEEIDRLLALRGHDGTTLDGVRIYLGGKEIEGSFIPTVHVVAVEKDGEVYNDFNVPKEMPAVTQAPGMFGAAAPGNGSTGDVRPCPAFCSGSNILNT